MPAQSDSYRALIWSVADRRRALLRDGGGRIFYPAIGTPWTPTAREQALCESYIVLFVAELETYLEDVVQRALNAYMTGIQASMFAQCKASAKLFEATKSRSDSWKKNNNTNWSRIGEYFEFVGLPASCFPAGLWDDVQHVALERGGIVHKSIGVRTFTDPRIAIRHAESLLSKLRLFDRDASIWLDNMESEVLRMSAAPVRFIGGLGTIGFR
jgi:hypothetical protein